MRISIVQTPHSKLNLKLPAGMERVALEELRLLSSAGNRVRLFANNVIGEQPDGISLGRMKNITRQRELFFLLKFLLCNINGDIFIGFYTPMLALIAPKRTFVYFQGEAVFALPLERYQWAFNRYNKARYLFCSDYVRQRFIERHPRINKDHLFVLYNGVDARDFSPSLKPRRHGPTRFSFHGRWVEDKGILILLEAVKLLEAKRNDFECYIAGSPEVQLMVTLKEATSTISALRNQRFLKAQAVLRKVINILIRKYHVRKIILIGSLTDKQRFGFHSDIDLCVEGLPDKLYFMAVGELLLEADEFNIDIIPLENATPKMKERVEKGRLLYRK